MRLRDRSESKVAILLATLGILLAAIAPMAASHAFLQTTPSDDIAATLLSLALITISIEKRQ